MYFVYLVKELTILRWERRSKRDPPHGRSSRTRRWRVLPFQWQVSRVLVVVGDISKVLEGHLGIRQVRPECQVERAAILITDDMTSKGKLLERREERSSHSPVGEVAFTRAWGFGCSFPGACGLSGGPSARGASRAGLASLMPRPQTPVSLCTEPRLRRAGRGAWRSAHTSSGLFRSQQNVFAAMKSCRASAERPVFTVPEAS